MYVVRTLRTEVVQCGSDSEFLCKLACLRAASARVFRDAAAWAWFVDAGRQVLTDLLLFADKASFSNVEHDIHTYLCIL